MRKPFVATHHEKTQRHRASEGTALKNEGDSSKKSPSRAFRGLALVFVLTFVNMLGVLVTITAIGMEPWGRWQFVGLFGLLETAAGLSNIVAPNIWRLPVAEMETSKRTPVRLAATTMLIPHWGGAARAAAGVVLVVAAGVAEGLAVSTLLIVPLIAVLTVAFVGISAVVARLGVAFPHIDTIQFIVRWRGREKELAPLSLSASLQQFALGVLLPQASSPTRHLMKRYDG
jgi:hypothetical protein